MSKFRKAAVKVAATERFQSSFKKDRFVNLQQAVKERKKSIQPNGNQQASLNSKYEEEAKLEEDMKKLYNARYEMSDEDLSNCSSGLENALNEDDGSDSYEAPSESEEEVKKEPEIIKKQENGNESDETASISSDIKEMLEAQGYRNQGEIDSTDDDDDDEGDDEESLKSDYELDNIIESDGEEESDEAGNVVDQLSDDGVNYSALEEDEDDSDGFSFTGMTESPTGRDSRSSFRSFASKVSGSIRLKRTASIAEASFEEELANSENKEKKLEETIEELQEEEIEDILPEITYSRSVSDIEEYESDVFDLENEEMMKNEGYSYDVESNDSEGEFSIPRVEESDGDDVTDYVNALIARAVEDLQKDVVEVEIIEDVQEVNEIEHREEGIEEIQVKEDYNVQQDVLLEENKEETGEDEKQVINEDENDVSTEDFKDKIDSEKEQENCESDQITRSNETPIKPEEESNNEECKTEVVSALDNDSKLDKTRSLRIQPIVTYQMLRKKDKKVLTKKERMEIFERSHKRYNNKRKKRLKSPPPDPNIPSYKAKLEKERLKAEAVSLIIEDILERTHNTVDERERERQWEKDEREKQNTISSFLDDLLYGVNEEARKRKEHREAVAAAEAILDDVFDMWEGHVDTNDMIQAEKELENLSSCMIMATMIVAARDVAGVEPYMKMLHRDPIFKKAEKKQEKKETTQKRKLLSKKDRELLRVQRREKRKSQENANKEQDQEDDLEKSKEITDERKVENEVMLPNDIKKEENDGIEGDKDRTMLPSSQKESADVYRYDLGKNLEFIYSKLDDGSSGKSAVATVKRGEGTRKIKYEDDENVNLEDANSLGSQSIPWEDNNGLITRKYPKAKLQEMRSKDDEKAEFILTSLPKADKNDYCFQWVMNSSKIPSPPLKEPPNDRAIFKGRRRRFVRRSQRPDDRPESEASVLSHRIRNEPKVIFKRMMTSPSTDSGLSFAESGRGSALSVESRMSMSSHESVPVKVREEELDEHFTNDIREYFNGIMMKKIEERDEKIREMQEKEHDERKQELDSEKSSNDGEKEDRSGKQRDNDVTNGYDGNGDLTNKFHGDENANYEKDGNGLESDESKDEGNDSKSEGKSEDTAIENISIKSEESFLPSETTFIDEDPNERFPTPETEPEPEEIEIDKKSGKKKCAEKWSLASTTLIRWRHFKPVIKEGATISDYKAQLVKLRRSRFKDLSLSKPRSLSDLHKPVKLENFEVQGDNKSISSPRSQRRSPRGKNSPRLVLPPITVQQALIQSYRSRIKTNSFSSDEHIRLPDINASNSIVSRQRAGHKKVKGAWY